ncbi:hypothetical protein QQS21_003284 [Conoideocrella luteorostrata]|uniref:Uncharacterized protein n=1 Tax=Conoideocrella luteorostrata TaxID=1105319 RepID=A0AAJ0CUK3_9HYPO|nr:hypothetical protein QQS21_003284 [Conoideocrella luteorostrata]
MFSLFIHLVVLNLPASEVVKGILQTDTFWTHISHDVLHFGCVDAKRDLVWNINSNTTEALSHAELVFDANFRTPKEVLLALVTQIAGDWAQMSCTNCMDGQGDWVGCVVPPPAYGHLTMWACANCIRRGIARSCSLRLQAAQFQAPQSMMNANMPAYHGQVGWVPALPRETVPDELVTGVDLIGFADAAAIINRAITERSDDVSVPMDTESVTDSPIAPAAGGKPSEEPSEEPANNEENAHEADINVEQGEEQADKEAEFDLCIPITEENLADMEWDKLINEPLMTMEELDKELEGWYE